MNSRLATEPMTPCYFKPDHFAYWWYLPGPVGIWSGNPCSTHKPVSALISSFLHPSITICSFSRSCWLSSPLCHLLPPLHLPAFLICLCLCLPRRQSPSTLPSPWIHLPDSDLGSSTHVIVKSLKKDSPIPGELRGQKLISNGGDRRSLTAWVGAQMALGSNLCSFTYHLWDIGLPHLLICEMGTKTEPRVKSDCFQKFFQPWHFIILKQLLLRTFQLFPPPTKLSGEICSSKY